LHQGNSLDFDFDVEGEAGDLDAGAGRGILGEIFGINPVYSGVIVHIVEENGDFDDLIEGAAGKFEDAFDVFEDLAGLGFDVVRSHFAGGGIARDLAGDEEEVAGTDGGGKRADGFGWVEGDFSGGTADGDQENDKTKKW